MSLAVPQRWIVASVWQAMPVIVSSPMLINMSALSNSRWLALFMVYLTVLREGKNLPSHYISIKESCQHLGACAKYLICNTIYYVGVYP